MHFTKCSINNVLYGHSASCKDVWHDVMLRKKLVDLDRVTLDFFRCLALNHSVQPSRSEDKDRFIYSSPSPDDEALCSAAAGVGIHLVERSVNELRLWLERGNLSGRQHERWRLLHVLEFSPERKRMSVIVRDAGNDAPRMKGGVGGVGGVGGGGGKVGGGRLRIFTKGADEVMMRRLWPGQDTAPSRWWWWWLWWWWLWWWWWWW